MCCYNKKKIKKIYNTVKNKIRDYERKIVGN